ncbi:MAG: hypothetical protein RR086_03600 [Clostridia bacterium]
MSSSIKRCVSTILGKSISLLYSDLIHNVAIYYAVVVDWRQSFALMYRISKDLRVYVSSGRMFLNSLSGALDVIQYKNTDYELIKLSYRDLVSLASEFVRYSRGDIPEVEVQWQQLTLPL